MPRVSFAGWDGSRLGGQKERTDAAIFATIVTKGPLSRRDISRLTGLSQSTITKAVKPMIQLGYVLEEKEQAQGPGRPVVPLRVNADRHYVVGVKIAHHELIGVVTDPQAEIRVSARHPWRASGPEELVAAVASLLDDLLAERPELRDRVEGLGVGLGGHVDGRTGVLEYSPILGWRDEPLADMLEKATGLYTVVENDVNALAVAEQWFGAGRDTPDFAVVTVGEGVGCGIVLDNDLVHGATGVAGELGHIVVAPDGEICRCGNRGCVETVAAEAAVLKAIADAGGPHLTSIVDAAALARRGEPAARSAFSRAGEGLGRAIAVLLNLVNPSKVVLSGEGVVASDLLIDSLRDSLERHSFSSAAADCELLTRPLPDEAWARGAAANVLRHLIARPLQASSALGTQRR